MDRQENQPNEEAQSQQRILESVAQHQLPKHIQRVIKSYQDVVGDRDTFLWQWAHLLFPEFTLSCVPPPRVNQLQDTKLLALMYISMLDDIAERHTDKTTFREAAKIPFDDYTVDLERDGLNQDAVKFAQDLWTQCMDSIQSGRRFSEIKDIFQFDLKQVLDAIEYTYIANTNRPFVTETELRTHEVHNMMMFVFADIDLSQSPTFQTHDFPELRRVLTHAQRMARMGNWITTWERELYEGDISSGIVARALETGVLSMTDLQPLTANSSIDEETVASIIDDIHAHDIEESFLADWRDELAEARSFEGEVDSVDIEAYLDGLETVMDYHLASKGLK